MEKTKNNFTTLLDEKFSDIKLQYTGPDAEIKIIASCDRDRVGEGTYGTIIQVEYNGAACAARKFNLRGGLSLRGNKSSSEKQYLLNCQERVLLRHPNIIQFFGLFCNTQLSDLPIQVMEKMAYSLTSYIEYSRSGVKIPIHTKLSILHDVAAGLSYLHCRKPYPIVHCYLSSNNVLLTTAQQAKISDVGLAKMFRGHSTTKAKVFMAPEIAAVNKSQSATAIANADPSVDVFSYGAVMLHTITQQWPEELWSSSPLCGEGQESIYQYLDKLMTSCLNDTPRSRPNVTNVLSKVKTMIKDQDTSKLDTKHKLEQDDGESTTVTKDKGGLQEKHDQSHEKNSDEIPLKQKLEEVGELSNEMDDHQNRVKQNPSKSNNHQEKSKKEKSSEDIHQSSDQVGDPDPASCSHASTDDHLDQNIRKDDGTDKQQSSIGSEQLQDDNEDGGTNVKKNLEPESSHDKEVQHDISTGSGPSAFDKHCPKVIDGKESTYIKRKEKGSPEECKHSEEKDKSNGAQKDVKDASALTITKDLEQLNVSQQKQNETCYEENKISLRSGSQQGQHKKQGKKQHKHDQDKAHNQNTHANQPGRKDDETVQQPSNRDHHLQNDHENNENSDPNVADKDQTKKGHCGAGADKSYLYEFDELGPKVIGFHNRGNTCYFNAMLQSIHQTTDLHYAIAEGKRVYRIENTTKDPLSIEVTKNPGQLTVQLRRLFCEINKRSGPISPHNLLHIIGKKNSRFAHGTQEDSHEVLRYLLSALRDEEIACIKQEILAYHGIRGELLTDKSIDGETKLYLKDCLSKASKGICDIDSIFGSYLISTTICHQCETPLQTTEFHFDFSLPLPEVSPHDKANAHSGASSKRSRKKRRNTKHNKGAAKESTTTTPVQEHVLIPEVKISSKIPEVVKSHEQFNLYLQENNLSHCSILDTKHLKLETALECCLWAFTGLDTLDENNKFICQRCSYSDGNSKVELRCVSKQILIHKISPVLILHIKRFIIGSQRVTKDNQPVEFPCVLDIAPFCTVECVEEFGDADQKILYGLYAVVEHNGSLHDGHYVTYVKRRPVLKAKDDHIVMKCFMQTLQSSDGTQKRHYNQKAAELGEWYYTNDSCASKCNFNRVKHCRPYLLFYELLPYM